MSSTASSDNPLRGTEDPSTPDESGDAADRAGTVNSSTDPDDHKPSGPAEAAAASGAEDLQSLVLGKDRETYEVDSLEEQRAALSHMLGQARQRVDVLSRDLDRRLFDQSDVVDSLRRLALGNRRCRVRLFVMDTGALVRSEHRLATLVKRLPTYFEIRGPTHIDQRRFNAAFVIVDRMGCIHRPHADLYSGEVCFRDPMRAEDLTRQFDKVIFPLDRERGNAFELALCSVSHTMDRLFTQHGSCVCRVMRK